jgi:DNA polymerase-1
MHLNIPREQAQNFQDAYFRAFPEIPKWHTDIKIKLVTTRQITTPLGRRCFFPGRPTDNDTIKSAIAYGPQSTIGDILNLGFYRVWKLFDSWQNPKNPIQILTQVHDSILIQYDPKDEALLVPLVRDALQVPITINNQLCKIGVDVQVGWNWGKYKKDNTFGLKDWDGHDDRTAPTESSILDRRLSELH